MTKLRIVFEADPEGDSVMDITKASKKLLEELPPIIAADYLQDIRHDTNKAYDRAMKRLRDG